MSRGNFAATAALMGDPVRASMLNALLDGRAWSAGELAYAGNVTPQTASSHLGRLVDGGLLTWETQGRHRYFRLAGPQVAEAIECLSTINPVGQPRRKALSRTATELRDARRCYNHLAGRLSVAIARSLVESGSLIPTAGKRYDVSGAGQDWFCQLGVDVGALKPSRAGPARQCLDWTERKYHLGGPLGVALLRRFEDVGWVRGKSASRAIEVTPRGRIELEHRLGLQLDGVIGVPSG